MKRPIYHRIFQYDRSLLPNAYLAALEEGVTTIEEARERTGATIGYPGWGLIYFILMAHLDSKRAEIIIETGSNVGCTSIVLAQALIDSGNDGRVLTFELEKENIERAQSNWQHAKVSDRITCFTGDTSETLGPALKDLSGIRFAFLDASHLLDDVLNEFEAVLPHLADDALVLFDNTYAIAEPGEDPRVNGALKEIVKRHGGNLVNFEFVSWFTPGLAIWQRTPKL